MGNITTDGTCHDTPDGSSHFGKHAMAECNATQRNETERKSRQDLGENPYVPDAPGPVDNGEVRINLCLVGPPDAWALVA